MQLSLTSGENIKTWNLSSRATKLISEATRATVCISAHSKASSDSETFFSERRAIFPKFQLQNTSIIIIIYETPLKHFWKSLTHKLE